jgi:hypothetical protein
LCPGPGSDGIRAIHACVPADTRRAHEVERSMYLYMHKYINGVNAALFISVWVAPLLPIWAMIGCTRLSERRIFIFNYQYYFLPILPVIFITGVF